jgi:YidC/Oxa1 family membrane protein insertase
MPAFINRGVGMFGLGPYFNLLPVVSVLLFLWQQKKIMPPPTDEQQAMQQRIMQFMMIFMGIMLYKVASGLGVYFIASSLWGVAERKYLPKVTPKNPDQPAAVSRPAPRPVQGRDGASAGKRKTRGKRG